MIHKRHLDSNDSYEISSKQARHSELADQLFPYVEIIPNKNVPQNPRTSDGEGNDDTIKHEVVAKFSNDCVNKDNNETYEDCAASTSGSPSHLCWVNADLRSEDADRLSFFPEYFEPANPLTTLLRSDDLYSSLLDLPPRKIVPVGPEHQADVPEWGSQNPGKSSDLIEKLSGTCVISMPDLESQNCGYENEVIRIECKCLDRSTTRCVRDHVKEAREKLKENLNLELFEGLGFSEMGEEVTRTWTEEEEHTFHEVVISNPASLGNNFWDHLPKTFPSRTHKELVSYYFNVFMLRKRADQNRVDPLNIDSDNDEWQRNEIGIIEEDGGEIDDISAADVENSHAEYGNNIDFRISSKITSRIAEDYYVRDDSCTSNGIQAGQD